MFLYLFVFPTYLTFSSLFIPPISTFSHFIFLNFIIYSILILTNFFKDNLVFFLLLSICTICYIELLIFIYLFFFSFSLSLFFIVFSISSSLFHIIISQFHLILSPWKIHFFSLSIFYNKSLSSSIFLIISLLSIFSIFFPFSSN